MNKIKRILTMSLPLILLISLCLTGCAQKATSATAQNEPVMVAEEEYIGSIDDSELFFDAEKESTFAPPASTEEYGEYRESTFASPLDYPLSTFSIDVDTASYSNIRRYLNDGQMPPTDAVRIEECINYFSYDYNEPFGVPVNLDVTISDCPWNDRRYLARVSVNAESLNLSEAPKSNLVFLLDVSGSMDDPDKLPLVKKSMLMLAENLSEKDTITIVVYAGASGVVLSGCPGSNLWEIERALDSLSAGGSTAGGAGIERAYQLAEKYFIRGGNNRVILCTDGDFNVGVSSERGLEKLIEEKRDSGIFLSVLGFGTGNIKDNKMETLADKGNGNYAYIDSLLEAKKILVNEAGSTLFTVAKDVKIQVEFNPAVVQEYRLVGYDNRLLNPEDFNDDKKDAGEMGAGHTVTAFYELILVDSLGSSDIDDLVFQENENQEKRVIADDDWMYAKLRYKEPDSDTSQLITLFANSDYYTKYPDDDFLFASAVAEFGLLLKDSEYMGDANFDSLIERARNARGYDENGLRAQFIQLADLASALYR